MVAPISVIIPTLNAETRLPGCASSLFEGVEAGLIREMIVTDGGSRDETLKVADAIGANIVQGPASRGGQLRRGCAAAKADWFLILHADTQLSKGWCGPVYAHMSSRQAGWFSLRFDRGGAFVAGWANIRSRMFGLPYGDQGLLIPRALYEHVGGYPDQPLMEDVALARALRGHLRGIEAEAITSAAKFRAQGWVRRGARNLVTLTRYFAGADPEVLAQAYRK